MRFHPSAFLQFALRAAALLTLACAGGDARGQSQTTQPLEDWSATRIGSASYEITGLVRGGTTETNSMVFLGEGQRRDLRCKFSPLYRYAIFYNGDIELHNGFDTDIRGAVHSNQNLFFSTGARLSFYGPVTCAGKLNCYNDFTTKLNGNSGNVVNTGINAVNAPLIYAPESFNNYGIVEFPATTGTARVNMVVGSGDIRDTNGNRYLDSGDANFAATAKALWGDNVKDGTRGVVPIRLPIANAREILERVAASDPAELKSFKLESIADMIVTGDPGDTGSVRIMLGNTSVPNLYTKSDGSTGTICSLGEFFDGQQMTVVKTLDVNVGNLKERFGPSFRSGNGVLYVSTTPMPGDSWIDRVGWNDWKDVGRDNYMPAVRLINAVELPKNCDGAFSIGTDRPMYIVGNLNTVNKGIVAIAADSITLTTQRLTLEVLDPTTGAILQSGNTREGISTATSVTARSNKVAPLAFGSVLNTNAIFVMGNTPSRYKDPNIPINVAVPSTYPTSERKSGYVRVAQSGGAHNVMRYLEYMGSVTHNFTGSIIVLFESKYARNNWYFQSFVYNGVTYLNYYSPPFRNYAWDSDLARFGVPRGMEFLVVQQVLDDRNW